MEVGVRELKAKLSEYLDRAAKGERVVVTDRGVPKAVIGPAAVDDPIARGIQEGWITPGRGGPIPPFRPRKGRRASSDILREDRDER